MSTSSLISCDSISFKARCTDEVNFSFSIVGFISLSVKQLGPVSRSYLHDVPWRLMCLDLLA